MPDEALSKTADADASIAKAAAAKSAAKASAAAAEKARRRRWDAQAKRIQKVLETKPMPELLRDRAKGHIRRSGNKYFLKHAE